MAERQCAIAAHSRGTMVSVGGGGSHDESQEGNVVSDPYQKRTGNPCVMAKSEGPSYAFILMNECKECQSGQRVEWSRQQKRKEERDAQLFDSQHMGGAGRSESSGRRKGALNVRRADA